MINITEKVEGHYIPSALKKKKKKKKPTQNYEFFRFALVV